MASNYAPLISVVMVCFDLKLQSDDFVFVLNVRTSSNPACIPLLPFLSGPLPPGRGEGRSSADGTAQHQLTFFARQPRTVRPGAAGHASRQAFRVLLCQLWVCVRVSVRDARRIGIITCVLSCWISWTVAWGGLDQRVESRHVWLLVWVRVSVSVLRGKQHTFLKRDRTLYSLWMTHLWKASCCNTATIWVYLTAAQDSYFDRY